MKPIRLSVHGPSPNPVKVAIILEELGLEYETYTVHIRDGEHKKEEFTKKNPNGRLPAIEDPNTGITMFESGAIVEYLVETYDKEKKLQYDDLERKWLTKSWLHFQMSGQGPYFGQVPYFTYFHWEKDVTPSVIERFEKEIKRVSTVIDTHLKSKGTPYLLGDKATYADLAFIPWYGMLGSFFLKDWKYQEELPTFAAWRTALFDREAVKKVYAMKEFQRD